MDASLVNISINVGLLATGFGAGYMVGKSRVPTTVRRECDIWFEYNPKSYASIEVYYQGSKIVTNGCHALIGKKCKYTDKKCILL